MKLDKKERMMFINQFLILEKLYPNEADYYSQQRKALEEGFELHYEWIFDNMYEPLSEDECREVLDILNMYRAIQFSYNDLEEKSGISERKIKFPGFDGNNESKQLSYAEYYLNDLKRYNELQDDNGSRDYNSHRSTLKQYRQMLKKISTFKDKRRFTKEELIQLLEE